MNLSADLVPVRIALGRWENETTYWTAIVERYRVHHLGIPMNAPGFDIRNQLALGLGVFTGVGTLPLNQRAYEILRRTEMVLHSPALRTIYFDVTGIASAARNYGVPSRGYFARKELELVVVDPALFRKTRFFENGTPLWRNGVIWSELLKLRNRKPPRLGLLIRSRQRDYLEQLLEG